MLAEISRALFAGQKEKLRTTALTLAKLKYCNDCSSLAVSSKAAKAAPNLKKRIVCLKSCLIFSN